MKRKVSALHYLTEGFADSWMLQQGTPALAGEGAHGPQKDDPWFVSELAESLARAAHRKSSDLASVAREFFGPIVDQLAGDLKPKEPLIAMGGIQLVSSQLDFSGNVEATDFFQPIWTQSFSGAPSSAGISRD